MRILMLVAPATLAACTCNPESVFPDLDFFSDGSPEPEVWGSYLSMRATPDGGRLALAYSATDDTAVGFAVGTPQEDGTLSWVHERVDGWAEGGVDLTDVGKYTSLAIDGDGIAWIAYTHLELGGLLVAKRVAPGVWTSATVDPDGGSFASLDIGVTGLPIAAHVDVAGGAVRLSRMSADGTWANTVVYTGTAGTTVTASGSIEPTEASVGYTRLTVIDGAEWLAFADLGTATTHLADVTTTFNDTIVDDQGAGTFPSLSSVDGTLRLVSYDAGNDQLKLSTRTGGSWSTEVVDSGDHRGADPELVLLGDELAIVYQDGRGSDLVLARATTGWTVETLSGADGAVGFHNEVVKLGATAWVATYDYTNHVPIFLTL